LEAVETNCHDDITDYLRVFGLTRTQKLDLAGYCLPEVYELLGNSLDYIDGAIYNPDVVSSIVRKNKFCPKIGEIYAPMAIAEQYRSSQFYNFAC